MAAAVGRRRLAAQTLELSSRDWNVLRSVRDHRFLTTDQIARLHFHGHRSPSAGIRACVRVLTRLRERRLLARLPRTVGGLHAGSKAFVWTIDVVGDRLLRREAGGDEPRQGRRFDEPTVLFLEHTLAVAELRVRVEEAARAGLIELEPVQTEPTCWRPFVGSYGTPVVLKPDLAFQTAIGAYEDHWFIEVDRGTESIRTVLAKCAQYEAYRRSGREQAESGVFPLVVWSVPNERRRTRLEDELRRSRELDTSIFRIALPESVVGLITGKAPPGDIAGTPAPASTHERRNQ